MLKNNDQEERGYILAMTVVIMAIIAIIVAYSLGSNTIQQSLSFNYSQKHTARQNADNALSYAESWVVQNPMPSATGCSGTSNTHAVCVSTDFNMESLLEPTSSSSAEGTIYSPSYLSTSGVGSTYQYPRFYIQDEGFVYSGSSIVGTLYKITSAAYGPNQSSKAIVQAMYVVQAGSTASQNTGAQITWIELQ